MFLVFHTLYLSLTFCLKFIAKCFYSVLLKYQQTFVMKEAVTNINCVSRLKINDIFFLLQNVSTSALRYTLKKSSIRLDLISIANYFRINQKKKSYSFKYLFNAITILYRFQTKISFWFFYFFLSFMLDSMA